MPKPRKHLTTRWGRYFLLPVLLLLICILALPKMVEIYIIHTLSNLGFESQELTLGRLNWTNASIQNVYLHKTTQDNTLDIRIPEMYINYSLLALTQFRAQQLTIPWLMVNAQSPASSSQKFENFNFTYLLENFPAETLQIDNFQFTLNATHTSGHLWMEVESPDHFTAIGSITLPKLGVANLWAQGVIDRPKRYLQLLFDPQSTLTLEETKSSIPPVLIPVNGELIFPEQNIMNTQLEFKLKPTTVNFNQPMNIEGGQLFLGTRWDFTHGQATTKGTLKLPRLVFPQLAAKIDNISVNFQSAVSAEKQRIEGKFSGLRAYFFDEKSFSDPLAFTGTFSATPKNVNAAMNINDESHYFTATTRFDHDFTNQHGNVFFDLHSVDFSKKPAMIRHAPFSKDRTLTITAGTLVMNGHVYWPVSKQNPDSVTIKVTDLAGKLNEILFDKLSTTVSFQRLNPLTTLGLGKTTIKELKNKMSIKDVEFSWEVTPILNFVMTNLKANLSHGSLTAPVIALNPNKTNPPFKVNLKDIDLTASFKLINLDGLSGEGKVSGFLIGNYTARGLVIKEGTLNSTQSGVIRYKPTVINPMFSTNGKAAIVLQVLSEFRYKELKMNIAHTPDETTIKADIEGENPQFYGGLPLKFNFHIDAPLDTMLNSGFIGEHVEEQIRQTIIDAKARETIAPNKMGKVSSQQKPAAILPGTTSK